MPKASVMQPNAPASSSMAEYMSSTAPPVRGLNTVVVPVAMVRQSVGVATMPATEPRNAAIAAFSCAAVPVPGLPGSAASTFQ